MVYINGEFWGLYELKERLDESYAAAHHGADPEALDRIKLGWTHEANWELEQGSWEAFNAVETLRTSGDLASSADYAAFDALVDLPNFAAAQVAQGWIGNTDWWGNNIRMWRPTPGGEFRWMVYDFGHGWTTPNYDHLGTTVNGSWQGLPIGDALANDEFRTQFVNVHADFLNTSLAGDFAAASLDALASETRPVMAMQRDRWCGGATMSAWEDSVDYARDFAQTRAEFVERDLHEHMNLGDRISLSLVAEPVGTGRFELTAVQVEGGFSGTYYDGVPLTITALPGEGYRFVEWTGDAAGQDPRVTVVPTGNVTLTAQFAPE